MKKDFAIIIFLTALTCVSAKETFKEENGNLIVDLEMKRGLLPNDPNMPIPVATFTREDGFQNTCSIRGATRTNYFDDGEIAQFPTITCLKNSGEEPDKKYLKIKIMHFAKGRSVYRPNMNLKLERNNDLISSFPKETKIVTGDENSNYFQTHIDGEIGTSIDTDPMALAHAIQFEVNKLMMDQIFVNENKPRNLDWKLNLNMQLTVQAEDGEGSQSLAEVSILKTPLDFSSGYSLSDLEDRLKKVFKNQ